MKKKLLLIPLALGFVCLTSCGFEEPSNTVSNQVSSSSNENIDHEKALSNVLFEDKTVIYDGTEYSLQVENLPSGYSVRYSSNKGTEVGTYKGVADIYYGNTHVKTLEAILVIKVNEHNGISFNDRTYTYSGEPVTITITGSLPFGVSVSYTNNRFTKAGNYVVVATFKNGEAYGLTSLSCNVKIKPYDLSLNKPVFDTTFEYDGNPHGLVLRTSLPYGVTISGLEQQQTEIGEKLVNLSYNFLPGYESCFVNGTSFTKTLKVVGKALEESSNEQSLPSEENTSSNSDLSSSESQLGEKGLDVNFENLKTTYFNDDIFDLSGLVVTYNGNQVTDYTTNLYYIGKDNEEVLVDDLSYNGEYKLKVLYNNESFDINLTYQNSSYKTIKFVYNDSKYDSYYSNVLLNGKANPLDNIVIPNGQYYAGLADDMNNFKTVDFVNDTVHIQLTQQENSKKYFVVFHDNDFNFVEFKDYTLGSKVGSIYETNSSLYLYEPFVDDGVTNKYVCQYKFDFVNATQNYNGFSIYYGSENSSTTVQLSTNDNVDGIAKLYVSSNGEKYDLDKYNKLVTFTNIGNEVNVKGYVVVDMNLYKVDMTSTINQNIINATKNFETLEISNTISNTAANSLEIDSTMFVNLAPDGYHLTSFEVADEDGNVLETIDYNSSYKLVYFPNLEPNTSYDIRPIYMPNTKSSIRRLFTYTDLENLGIKFRGFWYKTSDVVNYRVSAYFNDVLLYTYFVGENGEVNDNDFEHIAVPDFMKNYTYCGLVDGAVRNINEDIVVKLFYINPQNTSGKYTVAFKDSFKGSEKAVDIQIVNENESAVEPTEFIREYDYLGYHYTFSKWNKDFTNVTKDIIVKAVYNRESNNEEYVNWDILNNKGMIYGNVYLYNCRAKDFILTVKDESGNIVYEHNFYEHNGFYPNIEFETTTQNYLFELSYNKLVSSIDGVDNYELKTQSFTIKGHNLTSNSSTKVKEVSYFGMTFETEKKYYLLDSVDENGFSSRPVKSTGELKFEELKPNTTYKLYEANKFSVSDLNGNEIIGNFYNIYELSDTYTTLSLPISLYNPEGTHSFMAQYIVGTGYPIRLKVGNLFDYCSSFSIIVDFYVDSYENNQQAFVHGYFEYMNGILSGDNPQYSDGVISFDIHCYDVPGNEGAVMYAPITRARLIIDDYASLDYYFQIGFTNSPEYNELF